MMTAVKQFLFSGCALLLFSETLGTLSKSDRGKKSTKKKEMKDVNMLIYWSYSTTENEIEYLKEHSLNFHILYLIKNVMHVNYKKCIRFNLLGYHSL